MDTLFNAFLRSWPFDPWVVFPLLLTAAIYLRGWLYLRQRGSLHFGPRHLACFLGGLAALFLALGSPIEPFASLLLLVHMLQHLLLMMVGPPLLWLGAPLLPTLCGLPMTVRQVWIGPFLRWRALRNLWRRLTHPVAAWLLYVVATWFWHVPYFYELALASPAWHLVEHGCFLGVALVFWWPVVQPYPSRPRWSRWILLPYLFLADLQNTALSALLAFSDRVLYPHYERVPRIGGLSPLEDQAIAGALMWVPGSIAFLVPLVWIGSRLLYGKGEAARQGDRETRKQGRIGLPLVSANAPASVDLLRVPLAGRFLKWREARLAWQLPLFLLAAVVIADGFWGPPTAGMNLAGVLPWVHWRGLVVLGLLLAGNVFCMACPFLLPRTIARTWLPARRSWPRWLRSKWLAVGLLALFFWAYEAFSLWASPWWTAWIALGYFLAALVIDGLFRGAAFCKYVCPIGQFNFVQSLVSPWEVRVRDAVVCRTCTSKDCIRGRDGIPGCETHLFLPRKGGNMDCTFCLDCIHACPHDNIGIQAAAPGAALWHDRTRSGIGRFGRRPDVAALVLFLVFAAFANAAGMVAPVVRWQDRLSARFGLASAFWVVTITLVAALVVLPLVSAGMAAAVGRWWSADPGRWSEVLIRFSFALVPLGFGMWLTHYTFHFWTTGGTAVPVFQRAAMDAGTAAFGTPDWGYGSLLASGAALVRIELLFLDLGLLLSLYTGYRIAQDRCPNRVQAMKALAPWAVLMLLLFLGGVWIVFQPMEMRGSLAVAG